MTQEEYDAALCKLRSIQHHVAAFLADGATFEQMQGALDARQDILNRLGWSADDYNEWARSAEGYSHE